MSLTSRAQEEPPSCWNLEGGAGEKTTKKKTTEERGGGAVECTGDVTADIILLTGAPPTRNQA